MKDPLGSARIHEDRQCPPFCFEIGFLNSAELDYLLNPSPQMSEGHPPRDPDVNQRCNRGQPQAPTPPQALAHELRNVVGHRSVPSQISEPYLKRTWKQNRSLKITALKSTVLREMQFHRVQEADFETKWRALSIGSGPASQPKLHFKQHREYDAPRFFLSLGFAPNAATFDFGF